MKFRQNSCFFKEKDKEKNEGWNEGRLKRKNSCFFKEKDKGKNEGWNEERLKRKKFKI